MNKISIEWIFNRNSESSRKSEIIDEPAKISIPASKAMKVNTCFENNKISDDTKSNASTKTTVRTTGRVKYSENNSDVMNMKISVNSPKIINSLIGKSSEKE